MKGKFPLYGIIAALSTLLCGILVAQDGKADQSKIWPNETIQALRAQYVNSNGLPDQQTFQRAHGILPINAQTTLLPCFSLSFPLDEIESKDGIPRPRKNARVFNPDFYIQTVQTFNAANRIDPIWDGRVYPEDHKIVVGGYSARYNERPVATIGPDGKFIQTMDAGLSENFPILQNDPETILFDPFNWQLYKMSPATDQPIVQKSKSYLPITVYTNLGLPLSEARFRLEPGQKQNTFSLIMNVDGGDIVVASCNLSTDAVLAHREGYQPELISGCSQPLNGKVVTITFRGSFNAQINTAQGLVLLNTPLKAATQVNTPADSPAKIDGDFSEWRNIHGMPDAEGDYISYLYPNPDTDIVDFKVTNDDTYLYFYSRVVGAHGRTGEKGRYYWYTYIDLDADPFTGYPPTRDDNCYFGIATGDDSEAQFEFVGNRFVKTFFGFTGIGAEQEALDGRLKMGPSFYAAKDMQGNKRDLYKIEYVNRKGSRSITHDYTEGTSEDMIIALSPDGSEVEMRVEMKGFLWDESGKPLVYPGRVMNIAVGAEGDSDHLGGDEWGADSSPVIYHYKVK